MTSNLCPYTLEDLEEAKRELRRWADAFANDSSNNPDSFESQRKDARRRVRVITDALKEAGVIPFTQQEELERKLDKAFPSAASREVVLMEGNFYQRRFRPLEMGRSRKSVTEWEGYWVLLDENDTLVLKYKKSHPQSAP